MPFMRALMNELCKFRPSNYSRTHCQEIYYSDGNGNHNKCARCKQTASTVYDQGAKKTISRRHSLINERRRLRATEIERDRNHLLDELYLHKWCLRQNETISKYKPVLLMFVYWSGVNVHSRRHTHTHIHALAVFIATNIKTLQKYEAENCTHSTAQSALAFGRKSLKS